jgi:hypothetical protein
MVEFIPVDQCERRPIGRPATVVPQEMVDLLERSYETNTFGRIPLKPDEMPYVHELVKLAQTACRRAGRSLEYVIQRDKNVLALRMRDKRIYNRRTRNEDQ